MLIWLSLINYRRCDKQRIKLVTYEDSITIILEVSDAGAVGNVFENLTVTPIFGCGGYINGTSGSVVSISTPDFPRPYPAELNCIYDAFVCFSYRNYYLFKVDNSNKIL